MSNTNTNTNPLTAGNCTHNGFDGMDREALKKTCAETVGHLIGFVELPTFRKCAEAGAEMLGAKGLTSCDFDENGAAETGLLDVYFVTRNILFHIATTDAQAAYDEATGCFSGCEGGHGHDEDGNPVCNGDMDGCEYCAGVKEAAEACESDALEALESLRAGDYFSARSAGARVYSGENQYGDAPTWKGFCSIIEAACEQLG